MENRRQIQFVCPKKSRLFIFKTKQNSPSHDKKACTSASSVKIVPAIAVQLSAAIDITPHFLRSGISNNTPLLTLAYS